MDEDREKDTYLGDGLYASFDGYHIVLRTLRGDTEHWVALEPFVLEALIRYADQIHKQFARARRTPGGANE